jgi:hypothetical protein
MRVLVGGMELHGRAVQKGGELDGNMEKESDTESKRRRLRLRKMQTEGQEERRGTRANTVEPKENLKKSVRERANVQKEKV